jgi:sigma-B regulation protein RsbU (phosphoserine phosphatase)
MRRLDDGAIELTEPAALMAELNQHFAFDSESSQYFTAVYGVLDLVTREFRYTSAGHPGPLLISAGSGQLHKADPPAVGFLPNPKFQEKTIPCQAGDRLYFYTDGIFEMRNASEEEFGQERLRDALAAASSETLADSFRSVRDIVSGWSNGEPFDDDVSLIGIELR